MKSFILGVLASACFYASFIDLRVHDPDFLTAFTTAVLAAYLASEDL